MKHFNKLFSTVVFLFFFASTLSAQIPIDLGCMNSLSDGVIDLDRKNWTNGNTAPLSQGYLLNFDLPSNTFGDCMKITEVTISISVNSFDESGLPAGCFTDYFINTYIDQDLPFVPASVNTNLVTFEDFDEDLFNLAGDTDIFCSDFDMPFDGQVGIDILARHLNGCPDNQELVSLGLVTMDFDVCVTGIVDVAGSAEVLAVSNGTDFCIGQELQLGENGLNNTSWDWSGPNGFTSNDQDPLYVLADAADFGDYTVTVTDADGCTEEETITIDQTPSPNANATVDDDEVCEGQNILLDEDGGDGVMWEWSGPNSFSTTTQNPIINGSTSADLGTYIVTVTDNQGCSATSEVTISPGSNPTATADAISNEVCIGQTISLLETGGDADSWSWSGPDGFSSTDQDPTLIANTTDNLGLYSVTITDANGCTNESSINIDAAAGVTIDVTANSIEICPGEDIMLEENGGQGDVWSWEGPDNFSSTDNNPIILNSTTDNLGIYFVTVTDSGSGCTNVGSVTIDPGTPPNAIAEFANPDVCLGETIELVENGGDGVSWEWEGPNFFSSTDPAPTIPSAQFDDFGTFTVTVTDANGCFSTSEATIAPLPTVEVCLSGSSDLCANDCSPTGFFFEVNPPGATLEIELEFPGTGLSNFIIPSVTDGQALGICSDDSATDIDYNGVDLILPTMGFGNPENIVIEIFNAIDIDNTLCTVDIDPTCEIEILYTASTMFEIVFQADILTDGYILDCVTDFDPVSSPAQSAL